MEYPLYPRIRSSCWENGRELDNVLHDGVDNLKTETDHSENHIAIP